jgi:hypothetical protein
MTPSGRFVGPLSVAAGMACAPFLAEFLPTVDATKFVNAKNLVPNGYYRSDRYVRA